MAVVSLEPGYTGEVRDRVENYHGNHLVYIHWEGHLNFCAAVTLPLAPDMPFGALTENALPGIYGRDPAWAAVDLDKARWMLDGADWTPQPDQSVSSQGVGHKSLIRFWTEEPVGRA